jgi:RHS repeat-associated protein
VGGLLAENLAGNGVQFAAYDANGNVAALVNAATGAVSAQYEYGPFGEVIRETGSLAKLNPLRFSTKYQDDETGFLYYGYRYYNPSTGRWPNRDPLGDVVFFQEHSRGKKEEALRQLAKQAELPSYVFVQNDPEDRSDYLGLAISSLDASVEACMRLPTPAAQQACLSDLFDTLGMDKECAALAAAVQIAKGAANSMGKCAVLRAKSAVWLSVALARARLNKKCFCGGDEGHQKQLAQVWTVIGNCTKCLVDNGCAGPY